MRPAANDLTRGEFLFLGALLDGQPRTWEEIKTVPGWNIVPAQAAKWVPKFERYGWIERGTFTGIVVYKSRPRRRSRTAYRITEAGRRLWQECAEFWVFQIQSAQRAEKRSSPTPKPDFAVMPPLNGKRGTGLARTCTEVAARFDGGTPRPM
jgi:DNA-binding MarR family transcriptional regulator